MVISYQNCTGCDWFIVNSEGMSCRFSGDCAYKHKTRMRWDPRLTPEDEMHMQTTMGGARMTPEDGMYRETR